jgi:hypothetical protein
MERSGIFNVGADRGGLLTLVCGRRVEAGRAMGQGAWGRADHFGAVRSEGSVTVHGNSEGSIAHQASSEKDGAGTKKVGPGSSFYDRIPSVESAQEFACTCIAIAMDRTNSACTCNCPAVVADGIAGERTRTLVDPIFSCDIPTAIDVACTKTSCTCMKNPGPCSENACTRTNKPATRLRSSYGWITNVVDGIPGDCTRTESFVGRRNRDLPRLFSFLDCIFPVEGGDCSDVSAKSRVSSASTGLSHPKCPKPGFRSTVFK